MDRPRLLKLLVTILAFLGCLSLAFAGLIPFIVVAGWSFGAKISVYELGPLAGRELLSLLAGAVPLGLLWGVWRLRPWAWFGALAYLIAVALGGLVGGIDSIVAAPFNTQALVVGFQLSLASGQAVAAVNRDTAVVAVVVCYLLALACLVNPSVIRAIFRPAPSKATLVAEEPVPAALRAVAAGYGVLSFVTLSLILGGAWLFLLTNAVAGIGGFSALTLAPLWLWLVASALVEFAIWRRSVSLDHPGTTVPVAGAVVIGLGALFAWTYPVIRVAILALALGAIALNYWHARWWESAEPTLEQVRARWQERGLV
jgi:hypothetical protein